VPNIGGNDLTAEFNQIGVLLFTSFGHQARS
jgi:hypothetical protein